MAAIDYDDLIARRLAMIALVQRILNTNPDFSGLKLQIASRENKHFLVYQRQKLAGVVESVDAPRGAVILSPFYIGARPINKTIIRLVVTQETNPLTTARDLILLIRGVLVPLGLVAER